MMTMIIKKKMGLVDKLDDEVLSRLDQISDKLCHATDAMSRLASEVNLLSREIREAEEATAARYTHDVAKHEEDKETLDDLRY